MPQYNRGNRRCKNREYGRIQKARTRAWKQKDREKYERLTKLMLQIPSGEQQDGTYRRLRYVRYADDFLLGFDGPKSEAREIKGKLQGWTFDKSSQISPNQS